ncbi:MAG: DUF5694 domain-containing protein [Gemmatimonadota bacterium]|nr:DUF5694 domain-containing protein [Gemmatimonadota bacterium]
MSRILALLAALALPASAGAQAPLPLAPDPLAPVPPDVCREEDERIEVLLVGSYHMANPGADLFNVEADDVLAPNRQREIAEVVDRLAAFRPTRVAVESRRGQSDLPERYDEWRAGERELARNESQQIGFGLADRVDLSTIEPIDVRGAFPFGAVRDLARSDSTVAPYLEVGMAAGQASVEAISRWLSEGTIGETLYRMNTPEVIHRAHEPYLAYLLPVVNEERDPGADLLAAWYERNIRIFANFHKMGLTPEDRIFVIYGAGHVPILRHLIADSPYFCVEDPLRYLPEPSDRPAGR